MVKAFRFSLSAFRFKNYLCRKQQNTYYECIKQQDKQPVRISYN